MCGSNFYGSDIKYIFLRYKLVSASNISSEIINPSPILKVCHKKGEKIKNKKKEERNLA